MATVVTNFNFITLLLFGEGHALQRPFYAIFSNLLLGSKYSSHHVLTLKREISY